MAVTDTSVRALAKAWRPMSVEPSRRMIQKYLAGDVVPTEPTRDELAAALGVPASMLPLSHDSQASMLADLMAAVQRIENLERKILERVA